MATTATSYHHGDLRAALLDAAEAELAERGSARFTLRACARRAGVSHAAPAHHFKGVTGMMSALATRGFERLTKTVQGARDAVAETDLDGQMTATVRAYVGFARAEPELFRVMFRRDQLDESDEELRCAVLATYLELTSVIQQQRGESSQGAIDLTLLPSTDRLVEDILIGWCHIHGLAHLLIEGQLNDMTGADVDAFLERVSAFNGPRLADTIRSQDVARR